MRTATERRRAKRVVALPQPGPPVRVIHRWNGYADYLLDLYGCRWRLSREGQELCHAIVTEAAYATLRKSRRLSICAGSTNAEVSISCVKRDLLDALIRDVEAIAFDVRYQVPRREHPHEVAMEFA